MSFCATSRRLGADAAYLLQFDERRLTLAAFVALDRRLINDRILGLNLNEHHLNPISCTCLNGRPLRVTTA